MLYVSSRNRLVAIAKSVGGDGDSITREGNWPQWRGIQRDNRSRDVGLLQEWPAEGPPLLWRVDGIGTGIASVSVAAGKVYSLGYHNGGEYAIALSEKTAERLWQTRIGPETAMNSLMRWLSQRSPTVDGERLYAVTADGVCICLSATTGKELWRVSYGQEFAAQKPRWGFCDYPLVDGKQLVCTPGGVNASVVALDKETGKAIWQTVLPEAGSAAYGATVVAESGGVRQYVVLLDGGLFGVRDSDGKLLWRYSGNSTRGMNSYTPIVRGDFVYHGNGYRNVGFAALKLDVNDKQEFSVKEQYLSKLRLDPFQDSTVAAQDTLFTFQMAGLPMCVDLNTGAPVWGPVRTGGQGKAAITYADDRLYVLHADGRMAIVEPTRAGYQEKGSFRIPDHEPSIGATFPVVTGGRLFVRDNDRLFAYSVGRGDAKSEPIKIRLEPPPKTDKAADVNDRLLRSVFVPTPHDVVEKMLAMAEVKKADVVVDLGSGDGRIVIAAAKTYGCRAVGYELDRDLIQSSQLLAIKDRVAHLVTFERKDLFTADLEDVSVVAVYLLPKQLEKLVPQLEKLKPGSRIVSHHFAIPGKEPDEVITIESKEDGEKHTVYLWRTPLKSAPAAK
jgi:outer membrane protein assembly factor BamB